MNDDRRKIINQQRLSNCLPELIDKVKGLIKDLEARGIKPLVTQGYRSIATQNKLYALGRSVPGKIVTNAKGGQSKHNFGKAVDFAFIDDNGDITWNLKKFKLLGTLAKTHGLKWGGDWKTFKDFPHVEI